MLVQESLLEKTHHSKNNMQETIDESDETLSFCDLPLYSDCGNYKEWQESLSAQSQGSSSVLSCEQEYFEFCSPSSTADYPPESIIFCGKLIPSRKQHDDTSHQDSSKLIENEKAVNIKKRHGWYMFRSVFCLSKNNQKSTTQMHKNHSSKNMYNSNNHLKKEYDYPVHKMSLLTSSSGKARLRLFWFGVSRFSSEVEINDIKSRLSRRQSQSSSATLSNGSGLTGLIRVLSCGGSQHPNAMVVASTIFSEEK
ncbi:hypothetical protein CASFOL_006152 [Castilleja foliolosa]|uniref:Uncharacterized protein n=1 Tax=Castilleja foliolosa TaxID=1961234 RepID=A0ABD3E9H9_9LAMI